MGKTLLEMRSITKEFPGVKALDNVNLVVEEGEIRLPFSSLAGVGEAAAFSLREARETGGEYISIDDLQARAKVSSAVIDTLREAGSLSGLPESSQTTLF